MKSTDYLRLLITLMIISVTIVFLTAPVLAGGGHGETGTLEHVVSLEGKTGLSLLLAELYNDNRLLYALVVTATMAFLGAVVAQITEFVLKLMGIK
jgi:hypothetical protein